MGITIKEIAQMVGVSRGTVDRVIHGRYGVDPDIKARVEQVMQELNYKPNTVAKALKTAQNSMVFGLLIPNKQNKFFVNVNEGIEEAIKTYESYGVSIKKIEEDNLTGKQQTEDLHKFVDMNVQGIIMAAVDAPEVRAYVDEISGTIPVITYNTDLTDTKRLCFVGQNHIAAGRVAGDLMGRVLNKKGKIALLISSYDMLAHMERVKGFGQTIIESGISDSMIEIYETYESDQLAYKIVSQLIANEKDLVAICITGGGQAGAGDALADSEKSKEIKMVCFDTIPETVKHVQNGVVDFTIAQDPFIQGFMPIKIMYEYLAFKVLPKWDKIFTHIDIRIKDNIDIKGFEVFTGLYSNKT